MKLSPFIYSIVITIYSTSLFTGCSTERDELPVTSRLKFYGADSYEAEIKFQTYFQFSIDKLSDNYEVKNGLVTLEESDQTKIDEALKLDALFLFGVFTYHNSPTDFYEYPGTIDNFAKPKITAIKEDRDGKHLRVEFDYEHFGVFYKDLFGKKTTITKKFYMPNAPTEIYKAGFPRIPVLDPKTKKPLNTCSDWHDNSEAAFWYYWSPERKKCPASFKKSIHLVEATFTRRASTKKTFPEYKLLYNQHDDNSLTINFIIGMDEKLNNPKDLGRKTFNKLYTRFKSIKKIDGSDKFQDINAIGPTNIHNLSYKTNQFSAKINLHFVDSDRKDWEEFAGNIVAESDVMIYAGHSYEGYYFDPERLFINQGRTLPEERYQVFFLDSCTSWSYYNMNYFDLKKSPGIDDRGTKYLDIVSNAIGAPFFVEVDQQNRGAARRPSNSYVMVMSLLGMMPDGTPLRKLDSWQKIMQRITENSGYYDTALTSVMGDKDNPTVLGSSISVPVSVK